MLACMGALIFPFAMFGVALAVLLAAIPLARRSGFVDWPGGRKDHLEGVPPIGGLVVFIVFVIALGIGGLLNREMVLMLAGAGAIGAVGLYDDWRGMNPWVKFAAQIIVACYLVLFAGAELRVLGDMFGFGELGLNIFTVPFCVAALVLLMNAMNMMDGLDGLAGGIATIILGWFACAAAQSGQGALAAQITGAIAPLLAFLTLNLRHPLNARARVFLGDAGSLMLAVIIGWFAIRLAQEEPVQAIAPIGVAWLLAVPVIDALAVFFIRARRGAHPFAADRNHLHHRFMDRGVSPEWTVAVILGACALCGFAGVVLPVAGVPLFALTYAWMAAAVIYVAVGARGGAVRRFS